MSRQFVEVLNPRGQRYLSQKRADFFIHRGFAVMAGDKLKFREEAELALLRRQAKHATATANYDRAIDGERGGIVQGEWLPMTCGEAEIAGGPEFRTLQFVPSVKPEEAN